VFWAESPADKRKVTYMASVRVQPAGEATGDVSDAWYVQVLSTRWRGGPVDSCAVAWDTFPPPGSTPAWLATPETSPGLASDVVFHHLASRLIQAGAVDVAGCPDGGLTGDGAPSACGAEQAAELVLMAESIRWPFQGRPRCSGRHPWPRLDCWRRPVLAGSSHSGEYSCRPPNGAGADNTLLWNKTYYDAYCPSISGGLWWGHSHQRLQAALLRGPSFALT
jgi:hypothetical protein